MPRTKMILPFNKKTLNHYELILTEDCNFRCKYCFDDTYSKRIKCNYNPIMEESLIPDIINFITSTRNQKRETTITFFGGEPLLRFNFIKSFVEAAKNLHFIYSINTNISLINKEILDFLLRHRFRVCLSIDGNREGHDATRVLKNGQGSWKAIMSKIPMVVSRFNSIGLPVTAMMVVDSHNYKNLKEDYIFLKNLGIQNVNILWNFGWKASDEELLEIKQSLTYLFKEKKYPLYLDAHRRLLSDTYKAGNHYCNSVRGSVTINPKGDLFFCHRLVPKMSDEKYIENPEILGNIYQGYINTEYLKFIDDRTSVKKLVKNLKECKTCKAFATCKGGCIGAIRGDTGNYGTLDSICRIQKMLYDLFLGE